MFSIAFLNASLNAALWFVHALLALLLQAIYVSIARLQLTHQGRTKATDSDETNVFHWLSASLAFTHHRISLWDTAIWSFAIMIFALLFLPAELIFETGIDLRLDCAPETVPSPVGVCAAPWAGHSDVGVASAALLVQRFTWVDQEWDVVFEGASKSMVAGEVHQLAQVDTPMLTSDLQKLFAYNCKSTVSSCEECGTMTVFLSGGPFDTVVSNASLAHLDGHGSGTSEGRFALGDITYDGALGAGFIFWELPEQTIRNDEETNLGRIRVRGVETLLSTSEVARLFDREPEPWDLALESNRTRVYDITCDSPGLKSRDLAHAVSLYRTSQMEQPGVQRSSVGNELQRWAALSASDTLKALFALKAEDGSSTCQRMVPVYRTCGTFDWSKAIFFIVLMVIVTLAWLALWAVSRRISNVDVPHDSRSWRAFVMSNSKQFEVEADRSGGGRSFALVLKSMVNQVPRYSTGEVSIDLENEEPPSV